MRAAAPGPATPEPEPAAPDDTLSDTELLAAHLAGSETAFGTLFTRHRDRLWAVALRTTGDPEDAADALQDALVAAFRRAGSFRGDSAVTTWLHRIVVNASLDRLRRNRVRAVVPLPDEPDRIGSWSGELQADRLRSPLEDPVAHAEAADLRRVLLAALDRIPPDQRVALVLVDMEAYPVHEAAAILDVPVGTVKSRCARGRARLAGLLRDLEPRGTGEPPAASHPGGER